MAIKPDDTGFSSEAEKGILGKVGGIASKAAGVFAGAFVAKQGFDFLGGLVKDASESRRVLAETEQAIKATGGVANVSAKDITTLADALSRKTGIDDEQIQSAENLLLTFRDVKNQVGDGNDIFNQATKAVLDLSKQFGGTEASAVQIGKALNDPIAGVSALTRVGVQFTDAQKDQIKTLVESGRTLEAQKIILGEINSQVGGQAEAQATAAQKLSVVWGNLREELGARLLPIVDKVATFLADKLPEALDKTGKVLGPFVGQIGAFIQTLTSGFFEDEGTPIERFALMLRDTVFPIVMQVFGFIRDNLRPILIGIGAAFLLAAGPVVALGAGLFLLYTRFQVVRDVIGAVAAFLTGTVAPAIGAVVSFLSDQFGQLADFVRENWAGIQEAIGHVIVVVQAIIESFVSTIQAVWRAWGDEILNVVRIVWDQIQNVIDTVIGIISGLIRLGLALINGEWGQAWDAIKDILSTAWDFIVETVTNALRLAREQIEAGISGVVAFMGEVPGKILAALGDLGSFLFSAGEDLVRGLINGIKNMASAAYDAAKNVVKGAVNAAKDFLGIGSPSKVFMTIGEQTMQGYVMGLDAGQSAVEQSMTRILGTVTSAAENVSGLVANAFDDFGRPFFIGPDGKPISTGDPNARFNDESQIPGNPNFGKFDAWEAAGRPGSFTDFKAQSGTMILSITGPLVNVEGSVVPGQEEALGKMAEQAVITMVRNGTVGREMSNRTAIISRR